MRPPSRGRLCQPLHDDGVEQVGFLKGLVLISQLFVREGSHEDKASGSHGRPGVHDEQSDVTDPGGAGVSGEVGEQSPSQWHTKPHPEAGCLTAPSPALLPVQSSPLEARQSGHSLAENPSWSLPFSLGETLASLLWFQGLILYHPPSPCSPFSSSSCLLPLYIWVPLSRGSSA